MINGRMATYEHQKLIMTNARCCLVGFTLSRSSFTSTAEYLAAQTKALRGQTPASPGPSCKLQRRGSSGFVTELASEQPFKDQKGNNDEKVNNEMNFNLKIDKLETNLDIWKSIDLTLFGKVMIIKALGVSSLTYSASNINIPKDIISNIKGRLFRFIWKNKRDKIRREGLY